MPPGKARKKYDVILYLPSLDDDGGGVLICSSSILPERVTIN